MSALPLGVIAVVGEAIQDCSKARDCCVACAPWHKRFAFVAGNDGSVLS